jgi:outer membrane protein TolC
MRHQPSVQQSLINQSITKATNAIDLSGWYPQVGITANLTNNIQLPTSFNPANGVPQKTGIYNTAIPGIGVTQAIYNPSLIYASKSAPLYLKQAQHATDSAKIDLVSAVSKSFYSLLLTLEQIDVLKEDTVRLGQNVRDAYHQYIGGTVDETDYEEATITLNNSMAQLKQANENVVPQYATLKQLMGYAPEKQFNIQFDTAQMTKETVVDTTEQLQYEKRIEFQQLATAQDLQHQLTGYYQHAYLPTLSAFYNYNYELENDRISKLYNNAYPNSQIGLTLSLPVFTGFWRVQNVHRAQLQEKLLDWSALALKSQIYSEYTSALANYKSNLYNLNIQEQNTTMAKRVYFVVTLQYKQGLVAYLNVITAESNLITSEIGYLNALFQLLSSKIDLEKALGDIPY